MMDVQLGVFYLCGFFYHRVLNLAGSVGTTNEINARRREKKKNFSLPLP
jgi:hypothetical protein